MITFILNDKLIETDFPSGYVLLDFLRKNQRLTGTKEGCREGDCGACTVLIGQLEEEDLKYRTINSCLFPLGDANGKHIVTIEGLNQDGLNYLQEQFVENGGTQCGFCTPGFIVSSMGYLIQNSDYKTNSMIEYLAGNICRCTGYSGIRRSISNTISFLKAELNSSISKTTERIRKLVELKFLPEYFLNISDRLKDLQIEPTPIENQFRKNFVSGGTDLYVQRWEELINEEVNLISKIKGLNKIEVYEDEIRIGGSVTIAEIEESELIYKYLPEIRDFLKLFGSKQIRNRATIAGNIVNASPIGDMTNILLALNAQLQLSNGKSNRVLPLRKFYKGYKTLNKSDDEFITAVSFKIPFENYYFNFEKVSRRTYLDIASVNSTFFAIIKDNKFDEVRISAGGVAPIPMFLEMTSEFLTGKNIDNELILKSLEIAAGEISPISDARGSAEYKSLLLRQLILAHFEKYFPELVNEIILYQ